MNPNADDQPLREKIWRHDLTPAEQAELRAWLNAHPEATTDLETERKLTALLGGIPDAPVPSNFTARVLQAVEHEVRVQNRNELSRPWWLRVLLPRAVAVSVIALGGIFAHQAYQANQRTNLAKSLEAVAGVDALPSAEALEDFETIVRLAPPLAADEDLVSLMAKLQ